MDLEMLERPSDEELATRPQRPSAPVEPFGGWRPRTIPTLMLYALCGGIGGAVGYLATLLFL